MTKTQTKKGNWIENLLNAHAWIELEKAWIPANASAVQPQIPATKQKLLHVYRDPQTIHQNQRPHFRTSQRK
ncbi:hypothetical protein AMELA_G00184470, partial [Ameiurus melas]